MSTKHTHDDLVLAIQTALRCLRADNRRGANLAAAERALSEALATATIETVEDDA